MKSVEEIREEMRDILLSRIEPHWAIRLVDKQLSIEVGGEVVAEKDEDCVITETRPRTIRDLLEGK